MISIIIPSYNMGKFIRRTLDSILCQDFHDYEVIVVDGYSTDNTSSILDSYGKKIRKILLKPTGQVNAINVGMSLAKGDILAYLNADDIYEPGCLMAVNKAFQGRAKWVYGKGRIINSNDQYTRGMVTKFKEIWQPMNNYRVLTWFDYISQPTVFWRKEMLREIGYFNNKYKYAFDYDYWLRMGKLHKPLFIDGYLACWRFHPQALSVREYKEEMQQAYSISELYDGKLIDSFIRKLVCAGVIFTYSILNRMK